jgi:hypothetical protein
MGNHEYCVDCGESDFHHHRPCNPKKVADRLAAKEHNRVVREENIARMNAFFANHGVPYTLDKFGNAIVSCNDFASGNSIL